jgi:hypothetical protein
MKVCEVKWQDCFDVIDGVTFTFLDDSLQKIAVLRNDIIDGVNSQSITGLIL